jgi:Polysaccharide pyruvyl transferase/2OG-Fe(II) oxygenase superfamily
MSPNAALQVGICGTFDVENYGDLLFPLIAEVELTKRLGPIDLHRFSYFSKSRNNWPFDVSPLAELPLKVQSLDGILIGGGHLIRFDKDVAPGYAAPTPGMHHPTGYWLVPALLGISAGRPVAWNAPGVHGDIPSWAEPLMQMAIGRSRYAAVRDVPARDALARFANGTNIAVVPDTAFGVARLLEGRGPTAGTYQLGSVLDLSRPYLVVQATTGFDSVLRVIRNHPDQFRDFQLVALPIGPIARDRNEILTGSYPEILCLPHWPRPLQIVELIKGAAGVIGTSLHLAITAIAFGVPVFRPDTKFHGKYAILSSFDGVHSFAAAGEVAPQWLRQQLGRGQIEPTQLNALAALDRHWDEISVAFTKDARNSHAANAVGAFWQNLPNVLDGASLRYAALDTRAQGLQHQLALCGAALSERDQRIVARDRILTRDRAGRAAHTKHFRALHGRNIGNIITKLRAIGGGMRSLVSGRRDVIDLARLEQGKLATQPYEWTFVNGLYSERDAKLLADYYPTDNFKTVRGYDGEKSYEYEARALIKMWDTEPFQAEQLTDTWRRLANSLMSPNYRAAMSRLTGRDLSNASMEAYVCHYGPGAWLGPHLDLKDKIVTHVLYFNQTWNQADGGCLNILNSAEMNDIVATVRPIVGNSSVLVRSDNSWHAVSKVAVGCRLSRRSMNVIFYHPGAVSTMWPPGDNTPLHTYTLRGVN